MKSIVKLCLPSILACLIGGFSSVIVANTTVTVVEINDLHGNLTQMPQIPGIVKVAGELNLLRAKDPQLLFVSAGDNYQGTAMSNLTFGAPVNEAFRELGLVASAVGDHEFDWGVWRIPGWAKQGGFTYLAANIYNRKTDKPVKWTKPYLMITRKGEKIAFIGISTQETPSTSHSPRAADYLFKNDYKAAQYWVNYLNAGKDQAGKPDAIIALTHIPSFQNPTTQKIYGAEISSFCANIKGVAAVITAHSHQLVNGKLDNIPVIQAYKYGKALGIIKLTFANSHHLIKVNTKLDLLDNKIDSLPKDKAVAKIYLKYGKKLHKILSKVVGYAKANFTYNPRERLVTPLGDLVCNVMLKKTGADEAIMTGGGIRSPIHKGAITFSDVFSVFPFNNYLYVVSLTGKELKKVLEHGILNPDPHFINAQFAGVKLVYDPKKTVRTSNS